MINRSEHPYDKYFKKESVTWELCGKATPHLPKVTTERTCRFIPKPEKVKTSDIEQEHMLLFLDDHFDNHDIDKDPAKKAIKYIRTSWCTVYDKYEQYCKKMRLKPARYDRFCCIR